MSESPAMRFSLSSQGGDGLTMPELRMDEFVNWLCQHEADIVGRPCSCFHSPLAFWLSDCLGDGQCYGRALHDARCWRLLPRWASLFASWLEGFTSYPVTGLQALDVLARVELALRLCAA